VTSLKIHRDGAGFPSDTSRKFNVECEIRFEFEVDVSPAVLHDLSVWSMILGSSVLVALA